ncbi:MAG: choice-of-anchor J domain-containing protein [Prevotella sp.]|nr:choice-of-anchor J domain-containing protein [Prevotella sp.]MCM1074156.1 choice-of-anchor J domain-containing protein [Ruminococcus sp.]
MRKEILKPMLFALISSGMAMSAYATVPQKTGDNDFSCRSPEGTEQTASARHRYVKKRVAAQADTGRLILTNAQPGLNRATLPAKAGGKSEAKIFGAMIGADSWGYYDRPVGIYSISPNDGSAEMIKKVAELDEGNPAGTYCNGVFYACVTEDFYGTVYSINNIAVDMESGNVTTTPMDELVYSNMAINMTCDRTSGTIWTINYGDYTDEYNLCTFSPETNSYTVVSPLQDHYWGICFDGDGTLYAINDNGEVKTIDTKTGNEIATVASTNFVPSMLQSCCWSPTDHRIYWAACNYSESRLIAIDPATSIAETLTEFADGNEFIGLYCTDPIAKPKAPAACEALSVSYAKPSSNNAAVRCMLPTCTVDGSELTDPVTFILKIDGEQKVSTEALAPGSVYSGTFTLDNGVHKVEAVCQNAEGTGISASVATFAGADTPAAPQDLSATLNGATSVNLSWTAPEVGVNGGWFDTAKLSYSITRNGTEIASGLTETSYKDTVGEELADYTYIVSTVYDGVVCANSSPVTIIAGAYATLPYSNDFKDENSFNLLTVLNNNNDDSTWSHDSENQGAAYNYSSANQADDYLVFPRFKAEAGHIYNISFTARSVSSYYPEKMEVLFGNAPSADALTTKLLEPQTIPADYTTYSLDYNNTTDAAGYFALHCVSDADMSTLYVHDVKITDKGNLKAPKAPTSFTATPTADAQSVTLNIVLPNETNEGNPIGKIDKLEIKRNGKLAHTKDNLQPGTSIEIQDEADFGFNTYEAVAYYNGLAGVPAVVKAFAGTYTLPFAIEPNADEYTLFTAETNPDVDDNEWYFDISTNALKISTYRGNDTDQYIFTPVIELGDANLIDLSFDVCAGLAYDTEELEVTFGKTAYRSSQQSVGKIEFNNTEFETHTMSFAIPEPGRYYIGLRALSPARHTCLSVKNIKVDNGAKMLAPAASTDVEVKAAPAGALETDIYFTVPSVDLKGNELSSLAVSVTLTRADGTVAGSVSNVAPGSRQCIHDAAAKQGVNTYTLTSSNSYGNGGMAEASGWCGVDIPAHIENLEVLPTANNLGAVLTWTAPTAGIHNGWLDNSAITYNIYQLVNGRDLYKVGQTNETTYTAYPADGTLDFYIYYVSASTDAGEGITSYTGVMIGNPMSLPMIETASNRVITNLPWIAGPLAGDVNWGVGEYIGSLDLTAADGGMFVCSAALPERRPGAARMMLPKLNLSNVKAPVLTFRVYHYVAAGADLKVSVTNDEVTYDEVFTSSSNADKQGWKEYSVSLSDYAGEQWIGIVFDGILTDGTSYMIVDDIEVANNPEYDMHIVSARGKNVVEIGETASYKIEVKNGGKQHVPYTLTLKANGETIGEVNRESKLPSGSTDIHSFDFTATADHIQNPVEMEIEITTPGWTDEMPENNIASFIVNVVQPEMPVVTDLKAEGRDNNVVLSWTAPSLAPTYFTDSFDNYDSFIIDNIGDYTMVDGDGLTPCGILGVTFPNMSQPMAFQVWEPTDPTVNVDAEIWAPRSGNKCLVAWTSLSSTQEPFNDDWLISPELYCDNQPHKLSFFAKRPVGDYGPETFEVLYSTTGKETADFESIKVELVMKGDWIEYEYELPAGTRYFAIRYLSSNKFAMLFDDLTYMRNTSTGKLSIGGYNVYRNGVKAGETNAATTTFTDAAQDGTSRYNVTVNYDKGESLMSNTVTHLFSSAASIDAEVKVIASSGHIQVLNAAGRRISVCGIDGVVTATSNAHADNADIAVAPGIYIVTVQGYGTTTVNVK